MRASIAWGHFEMRLAFADGGNEEAVDVGYLGGLGALYAFDEDLDVAVGHFDGLHDVADGADLIDFFGFGLVDAGIMLGGEKDFAVAGECLFERTNARLAAHDKGRNHVREYHHVPNGHHG